MSHHTDDMTGGTSGQSQLNQQNKDNQVNPSNADGSQRLYTMPDYLHTVDDFNRDAARQKTRLVRLIKAVTFDDDKESDNK